MWIHWLFSQKKAIDELKERQREGLPVDLSGDGQFDSPGFTASFCTYTIQDLETKAVVALFVAYKHQVMSSSEMEVFSCKTLLLNLVREHLIIINSFTTDRSSSIKALLVYVHLCYYYHI